MAIGAARAGARSEIQSVAGSHGSVDMTFDSSRAVVALLCNLQCNTSACLFPGERRVRSCFLGNSESVGEGGNVVISERRAKGERRETMRLRSTAMAAGFAWAALTSAAMAHHSFAMFDTQHPIEISGTVREFRFVNPHSVLIVTVKGEDGAITDWTLECPGPGILARQGMTANSLKSGDAFKGTINPLHSGEAGGSYFPPQIDLSNGRPVAVSR
jgi:hypothetical protein